MMFHDKFVQQTLAVLLALYCVSVMISVAVGNTILLGAAISLYIFNPLGISYASSRRWKSADLGKKALFNIAYLAGTFLLMTAILYIITDLWNPDHFTYGLGEPPRWFKIFLLMQMQIPWVMGGFLLSLVGLVIPQTTDELVS